ncbi:hypothetical protein BU23DRAFT_572614 [Bimuria novae-zelandiae CBS 107.79]|uniref:DUF676 domain-containing protein n=1 Tax=Bimuria novae-zelandiae CBS 107.79 TaxID=1447943 RepID=A0A6A5USY6_9PLEO|nr:hypothetical protein BU23DRAFT_572614 [Bimuria novae-zelandiae CBS 107.79]
MDSGCGSCPRIPLTGLSVIVDPEQPDLDIVFLHGFTGHPERTWSCKKVSHGDSGSLIEPSSKRQKLSQTIHTITSRKEDETISTTQTTVCDIAWDFLVALEGERRAEPVRLIIFIVHSLGGIVMKEILRGSNGCSKAQTHLRQIIDSTRGIIFFGTPHGGADPRGLLHHVAEKLLKAAGFTFNKW